MLQQAIANMLPYIPKKLVWVFSRKYIAGATLDDAVKVSRCLNNGKCMVTVDLLGEFITNLHQAQTNKEAYLAIVDRFANEGIDGNFSVKPSSFGLLIDEEACYLHIRDIVEKAAEYGRLVRIDMEDSTCVDREIKLYRRLKVEFPTQVGLVLQAYLKRTESDLAHMMDMHATDAPLNFRLCKGIYVEPEAIAYKGKLINEHYIRHLEYMLANGIYVGIATHDKKLVDKAIELIDKHRIKNDRFEFQMLYGVTPDLRQEIIKKGFRMRVYVPYGKDWFGYSTRRLKENPHMVWHIIKSFFVRG